MIVVRVVSGGDGGRQKIRRMRWNERNGGGVEGGRRGTLGGRNVGEVWEKEYSEVGGMGGCDGGKGEFCWGMGEGKRIE